MRSLSFIILFVSSICFAQSPHGSNFNRDCQDCHTVDGWSIQSTQMNFKHSKTEFPLIGQHQNLKCKSCHISLNFLEEKGKTNCSDCHTDIHANTVGKNCERCHNPNTWIIEKATELHLVGKFPLLGNHAKADCRQCHKSASTLRFEPIGIKCYDCHVNTYLATKNPNHIAAKFSTDCSQCHNVSSPIWSTTTINHEFFPLTGAHNISNCFSCHRQSNYKGLSQVCFSCHQTDYDATKSPNHTDLNISKDCEQCHSISANSWKPAIYSNHDVIYPLLGAHNTIRNDCSKCHTTGYSPTARLCLSCHQSKYDTAVNPNHKSAQFSTQCETCHSTNAWKPATFAHDGNYFPIYSGEHKGKWSNCSDCHLDQTSYKNFECTNCHEHSKTIMDSEHQGVNGYSFQSRACYACHPSGSKQGIINHSLTNFPLLGAHTSVLCTQCHQSGYTGTPTDCISCHQSKFNSATNHSSQNYPQECNQCHTPVDWKLINYNHTITKFQLLGAHASVSCQTCHTTSLAGTPTICSSCHQANYTAAPNHVSQGYPTTCEQCHNSTDWKTTTFNHSTTKFPLLGSHVTVKCSDCHTTSFTGTPTICSSCHQSNYTAAPNHVSQGYPTTCEQCHNSTDWKTTTFNHSTTNFPLTGAHITVVCNTCHTSSFQGTSNICSSCHTQKYQSTTNPNHTSLGIPNTCEQCHTTNIGWKPATFPIHNNYFQILGAHLPIANQCANCHSNNYNIKHNGCVSCHLTDYNQVTNPNHATAKFPTDCESCHSQSVWKPSTFDHDAKYFPIYSGEHRGEWTLCTDCHLNQSNYKAFECINCHEHNKTEMDNEHRGESGYLYQSIACYNCHPMGKS
jgi:hypothetical protein